jgi:predicted ATPase
LHVNCLFNQVWGDWHVVDERSASLVSLADEHGFAHLLATGTFFRGWAAFSNGDVDDGIALMKKGLAAKRAGGAEIKVPYYLGVLADAYRQIGRVSDALPLLIEALERVEGTGEKWFEAELHRLQAEALRAQASQGDRGSQVEDALNRALWVARSQGARLWELRASMSLARLWRDQGRHADAGKLLAPVLGLFTEDIDMPDLGQASELLGTLRR